MASLLPARSNGKPLSCLAKKAAHRYVNKALARIAVPLPGGQKVAVQLVSAQEEKVKPQHQNDVPKQKDIDAVR